MKKFAIYLFLMIFLLALNAKNTSAAHLMGGNIGYQYLQTQPNGNKIYKIYLYIYRDCAANGASLDNEVRIGIFINDGNQTRLRRDSIPLITNNNVNPSFGGSTCSFAPNVCIQEGYYEKNIELPPDTRGYHITHVRCCRNNAILNLNQNIGQTYYAFIPNTNLNNSTPRFADVPVPYLCLADTINISNTAIDADGDVLRYELVRPYSGGSSNNPQPQVPNFLNLPIGLVNYANGYNFQQPFGANGLATIDSLTGIAAYRSPSQGNFVVAVNVKEYRNGVLISSTRRDIQILALPCPPNPKPVIVNSSTITFQRIAAGLRLTFPIFIRDRDSIFVSAQGGLFDLTNGIPFPRPTLTKLKGKDTLTTIFDWQTQCLHASPTPYTFVLSINDKGCPPKKSLYTFFIKVDSGSVGTQIIGLRRFCPNALENYTTNSPGTSTFVWTVTGGTITQNNGSSIQVRWGNVLGSNGTVRVVETNQNGCVGLPIAITTSVLTNILPSTGTNKIVCSGDTIRLGLAHNQDFTYRWLPNAYLSSDTVANPLFRYVNNSNQDTVIRYILQVNYSFVQCFNYVRFDTFFVRVHPTTRPALVQGLGAVCVLGTNNYSVPILPNYTYRWTVSGGTIASGQGSNQVLVGWGGAGRGVVSVVQTAPNGCASVASVFVVDVVALPTTGSILGKVFVCLSGLNNILYRVVGRPASSSFSWFLTNGTVVGGNGRDSILVNWQSSDSLSVRVLETNATGCVGNAVGLVVALDRPSVLIKKISTIFDNPNLFLLTWQGQYLNNFNNLFTISYRKKGSTAWVDFINSASGSTSAILPNLPTNQTYEFKIFGFNQCNEAFESPVFHQNMVLKGGFGNEQLGLNWNRYIGWQRTISYEMLVRSNNSTMYEPVFTFSDTANYQQQLILDDFKQCFRIKSMGFSADNAVETSYSNELCFVYPPIVYVPTAFSPNADALNDGFRVLASRVKDFRLEIFNRWGEQIFLSTDAKKTWDGKIGDDVVPSGLYVYLLRYTDGNDQPMKQNGTISVVK